MRVALVNNFFPPRVAGSAHFTEAIARELGSLGHEVLVLAAADNAPSGREWRDVFAIHRVAARSAPSLRLAYGYQIPFCVSPSAVAGVRRVLDEFSPDVIHENNQIFDLSLIASAWAARRATPVVLTIHTALIHEERIRGAMLSVLDRLVARTFLELSHAHVVAPDVFMLGYVARRYELRSATRVSSIPIGIDLTRMESGDAARARAALGIGDRPMLLSLGHVIPLRDRVGLVEALPRVLRKIPRLAVVVAGHVYDRRFLARAGELGVEDALIVLGGVSRDQARDLIAAADVGCHELSGVGFGTTSLELMGVGVASVAVIGEDNFPGVSLRNWENVVIVPRQDPTALADALISLIEDPALRDRIARAGRQLVSEHFTIQRVAEQYVGLYERLIKELPARGAARAACAGSTLRRSASASTEP